MAEYSSNTDLSQGQSETDLSDLFEGFLPVQAANAPEPNDLFEPTQQPTPNVDVALSLAGHLPRAPMGR
jgi:hypothetical protein